MLIRFKRNPHTWTCKMKQAAHHHLNGLEDLKNRLATPQDVSMR